MIFSFSAHVRNQAPSLYSVPSHLIIHISLGVGITGIARVTVGVALLLTRVIRRLSRLLLGRLAGL